MCVLCIYYYIGIPIRFQFIYFFFGGKINSNNRLPDRLLKQVPIPALYV